MNRSRFLILGPLLFLAVMAVVRQIGPTTYDRWVAEDGWVENLQVVAYVLAILLALRLAVRMRRRARPVRHVLAALAVAGLCGLVVLEEISWGQRWLHYDAPVWFRNHNRQDELTLHNLDHLNQNMHLLYVLVSAVLIAACRPAARRGPGRALAAYFLPALLVFGFFLAWPDAIHGSRAECRQAHPARLTCVVWRDQEPAELLMAVGVLLLLRHVHRTYLAEPAAAGR